MKNILLLFCLLTFGVTFAQEDELSKEEKERRERNIQAGNPFAKFGYKAKVATLSKGKYLEVHDLDSIVVIGTSIWHVKKQKIVGNVVQDTTDIYRQPLFDTAGRWISPDPLSEEFPEWSPYNFVLNNPLRFVDPKGLAPEDCPDCPKFDWDSFTSAIGGFFKGVFGGQQDANRLAENGNFDAAQRIDAKIDKQVNDLQSYADALSIVPGFSLAEGFSKADEGDALGAAVSLGMGVLDVGTGGGASIAKTGIKAEVKAMTQGMTPNSGGKIVSFVTEKAETYYRVSNNGGVGGFLTKIKPKSSVFAREGLALPYGNNANLIQKVKVPAGINLQRSRALPAFGRRGGLEQFEILNSSQRKLINYGKARPFN